MISFTSDTAPLISSTFTGLVADPSTIFHQEEHGVNATYNTTLYRSTLTGAARHTPENIGYKVCNEKFLLSVLLYFLLFIC